MVLPNYDKLMKAAQSATVNASRPVVDVRVSASRKDEDNFDPTTNP